MVNEADFEARHAGLDRERAVWAAAVQRGSEAAELVIEERGRANRWAGAVGRWIADASLLGDERALCAGIEALRSAHAGLVGRDAPGAVRLDGMLAAFAETAHASLDRIRQQQLADDLDPSTVAARMLALIDGKPGITSGELTEELRVSDSEVSRTGKALGERGLAVKTRHGKERFWHPTPRGTVTAGRLRERASGQLLLR
jgi:DNA-binding MarR family transcriptional regulator